MTLTPDERDGLQLITLREAATAARLGYGCLLPVARAGLIRAYRVPGRTGGWRVSWPEFLEDLRVMEDTQGPDPAPVTVEVREPEPARPGGLVERFRTGRRSPTGAVDTDASSPGTREPPRAARADTSAEAVLTPDEEAGLLLLDATRVAAILGCSYTRLCERLRRGEIPHIRIGARYRMRWPEVWEALASGHHDLGTEAPPRQEPVCSRPRSEAGGAALARLDRQLKSFQKRRSAAGIGKPGRTPPEDP